MKFGSSDAFTAAATPIGSTRRANSATVGCELGMATMVSNVLESKPHVANERLDTPGGRAASGPREIAALASGAK